jgi:hypothetical protein
VNLFFVQSQKIRYQTLSCTRNIASWGRSCCPGFAHYGKTYGSWLWLTTTVILVGAQLNAEMEHQTGPLGAVIGLMTCIWIQDTFRVIHDTQGRPSENVGSWADISDRKQAETALGERMAIRRSAGLKSMTVHVRLWHLADLRGAHSDMRKNA